MYCNHCGYDLKKERIEKEKSNMNFRDAKTKLIFVCPRCGSLIKNDLNKEEIKELSRASHAEVHRANNSINTGAAFLAVGGLAFVISFLFLVLSFRPGEGGAFRAGSEFYVFLVLLTIGLAGITFGAISLIRGHKKKKRYSLLIKDIQNDCFYQ